MTKSGVYKAISVYNNANNPLKIKKKTSPCPSLGGKISSKVENESIETSKKLQEAVNVTLFSLVFRV